MNWHQLVTGIGGTLLRPLPQKKIVSDQPMTRADELRAKADKYEKKATQAKDAEAKLLTGAAQTYRSLAALAERQGW